MKSWTRILRCIACVLACMMLFGTIAFANGPETEKEEQQYVDVSANVIKQGGFYETAEPRYDSVRQKMLSPQDETANAVNNTIATGIRNGEDAINIASYGLSPDQLYDHYTQVLNENPEFIHIRGYSYSYTWNEGEKIITVVRPRASIIYTRENAEELVAKAQEIVGGMSASFTDEQKILYLHDYLVTHCQYDIPTLSLTQKQIQEEELGKFNAYNALVEGSAVCQGYSEAMVLLGKYAGLDIKIVTSEAENHAWNMISLDNVYYFFDCTWDDPTGNLYPMYCGHSNLLRSRNGMVGTGHDAGTDWTCGGLGNVYDYCTTSTKYDSYFWINATSAIPMIGDTCAYANKEAFGKVYLRKTDGTEQVITVPDLSYWFVWNGGGYYWTTNYASFTSYGKDFYFSTSNKIYKLTTSGTTEKVHELGSSDEGYIYGIMDGNTGIDYWVGIEDRDCEFVKGEKKIELTDDSLIITGVNLTLQDNLSFNLYSSKSLYDKEGYGEPYVVFNVNGTEKTVRPSKTKSTETDYAFTCNNIAPHMIGDDIGFTIYVMNGTKRVTGMSSTYSVTTYCGKVLDAYTTKSMLTTLIVDLLNYGAAAQNYMDYKTDSLVNAGLTSTQQSWATEDRAFNDMSEKLNESEADLDDATFLGAALNLGETVSIRYVFTAESLSGLTLKVTDEKGNSWTFTESDFVPATEDGLPANSYSLYCRKLHAGRMSDKVYATLYRDGKKSMTVAYSIESYASKAGIGTSKLQLLLKAMMKYGDAARTIANAQ